MVSAFPEDFCLFILILGQIQLFLGHLGSVSDGGVQSLMTYYFPLSKRHVRISIAF